MDHIPNGSSAARQQWVGRSWKPALLHVAGIAAFLIFYFVTGPDTVRSPHQLVSDKGDTLVCMSILSWVNTCLGSTDARVADLPIFHPAQGALFFTEPMFGLAAIYGLFVRSLDDQNLAYNLTIILLDILNYYCLFLFLRSLNLGHIASFCGGTAFALMPFVLEYMGHIQLHPLFPFPLTLLALTRLFDGNSGRWMHCVAFLIALQLYFSTTLGIMLSFFVALITVCAFLSKEFTLIARLKRSPAHYLFHACAAVLLLFVMICPLLEGYYHVVKRYSFIHAWSDALPFSLDSLAFVALLFGEKYVDWMANGHVSIQNAFVTDFIGLTPPIAVLLVVFAHRNPAIALTTLPHPKGLFWCKTAVVLCLLAGSLALGPSLIVAGHNTHIPLPYRLFYHLFPAFSAMRVPARFVIPFSFFGSIAFAYLLHFASVATATNVRSRHKTVLILSAFLAIGAFFHDRNIRYHEGYVFSKLLLPVPKVYQHVQERPGLPVLEIPFWPASTFAPYSYYYYRTLDHNPRLAGISSFFPPSFFALRDGLSVPPGKGSLQFIASTEAKILIVHLRHLPPSEQRLWLKLTTDFEKFKYHGNIDGALLWVRE